MNHPSSFRPPLTATLAVLAALLLLPAASASADQIAYDCDSDLCLVDPDATSPINLTGTTSLESRPAWSPDGTRLAYRHNDTYGSLSEVYQLTVASPGTATNVSQTSDYYEDGPIQWSPGGERITYTSVYALGGTSDPGADVVVSPANGTAAPTAIGSTSSGENYGRWSPDGTKIAFARRQSGSGGIFIGNADGSGTPSLVPNTSTGIQPDWSRDGTRIASVIDAGTDTIRAVRADGTGTPVTLGDTTGFNVDGPFFSPDGTRVMWSAANAISIRAADGSGGTTTITSPYGITGLPPSWSPDGTRIAFSGSDANQNSDLFVANADGSGTPRAIATGGIQNIYPEWKPDPSPQPPTDPTTPTPTDPTTPTPTDPNPPVTDPPVVATRPPVTVSLADFRHPRFTGGQNSFVTIAYVSCVYPSPTALAAGCKFDANGVVTMQGGPRGHGGNRAAPKKTVKFGSGSANLAYDESGELVLKVSKAGKKLLKPGKKLKIKVTVNQRVGTDPVVTTTKTVKLKVPKKGEK